MQPTKKSPGLTSTERYLAKVCEKTFLSLWSYPNLYRAPGKELCDLLVVFDRHILIFSDKDICFNEELDHVAAWNRWRKKSIDKSVSQLHGAERWIRQNPFELYLDPLCEQLFPLLSGNANDYTIHLIAVTKNSHEPAKRLFGGGSSGSFMLFPTLSDDVVRDKPFVLNDVAPDKTYVHVFDEVTLDLVFQELDTASDFISYLSSKEEAIRAGQLQMIPGEEDLLGFYLLTGGLIDSDQFRIKDSSLAKEYKGFSLTEGFWREYLSSSQRAAMKRANEVSYFWDELIEAFGTNILAGSVGRGTDENVESHERAIRWMAREGRLARRSLSRGFIEKMNYSLENRRSSRVCFSPFNKNACFVLVLYPRDCDENYESYRDDRIEILHRYALACKVQFPNAKEITVIGTEPKNSIGRSEDVIAVEIDVLDQESKALALQIIEEDRILKDGTTWIEKTQLATTDRVSTARYNVRHMRKIGRNEPCRCGSGKKYKKCCLV